jgi:hypothetical protein
MYVVKTESIGSYLEFTINSDGKLALVCMQTDDCEATEILQDHADVAQ